MREIPRSRWPLLSPLLDELLDLDAQPRARRLQQLREQDPELAADLQELLDRQQQQAAAPAAQDFMAAPALALAEAAAAALNHAGQAIGAYTLEREIGQGGMGTVWLARRTDGRFEGQVAIKFLNNGLLGRADAGRFAREGQILARLAHPHIARLIDAGLNSESPAGPPQPYLVLEYIDGLPLDRFCAEHALGLRERVRLFLDVLAAVAHAHNRLILHRDLKPSNILVNQAGEVKLLDFGIAKLLGSGEDGAPGGAATELTRQAGRAFTPRYAAPEQVQGGEVTTATDVYALGVLLYLLLSGRHPTTRGEEEQTTPLERLRTLVEVEPKRLSEQVQAAQARELRGDLDTIVAKALKKLPAERYANAAALAEDLKRWLAHEPITARPDRRAYRVAKFLRRNRVAVATASLASLALLGSGAVALWKGLEAHEQRAQAEGLIEFMLGDLRKKLEPVGRLDVLDAVGVKALTYYAQQDLRRSDADSLGRRARALHLMGQIAQQAGRLSDAERMYSEAAGSTAELLQRSPQDGQRIFDHAQSAFWVGEAALRQGQAAKAEQQFRLYLELAERLWPLAAGRPEWLAERAHAGINLGILQLKSGQAAAALRSFQQALATYQELTAAQPDLRVEQVNTLGWISNAQQALGNFAGAVQADEAKLAALARMPAAAKDRQLQMLEANAHHEISRSKFHLGLTAAARRDSEKAVAQLEALSQTDKGNLDWVERYSSLRLGLAEIRLANGETQLEPLLSELQGDVERLLASDTKQLKWQCNLRGRLLGLRAQVRQTEAQSRTLAAEMRRYLADMQAIGQAGAQFDQGQRLVLARVALALGELLSHNNAALAPPYWQTAVEQLREDVTKTDAPAMAVAALAHFRLGRIEEARALAEKLATSSYRHPDVVRLHTLLRGIGNHTTRQTGESKA